MPGNTEENNDEHPILDLTPLIETDDILDLIPHIDRRFAMYILELIDNFWNTHPVANEQEMFEMFEHMLGELNEAHDILPLIHQINDAQFQILREAGLIEFF
jgi:hypothetical protein